MSLPCETWSSQAGYETYNMTRHSDDGTMAPRPFRFTRKPLVKVMVGPTAEEFYVHHELLNLSSRYFAARLRDCWQPPPPPTTTTTTSSGNDLDPLTPSTSSPISSNVSTAPCSHADRTGHTYTLHLPQVPVSHWEIIIDYLYTSQLPLQLFNLKRSQLLDLSLVILPLYHTADTLMLTKLQNTILDVLISNLLRLDFTCDITDCCQAAEFQLTHLPIYRFLLASCAHNIVTRHSDDAKSRRHIEKARAFPDVMCDILFEVNRYCRDQLEDRLDPREEPVEKWHVRGPERREDWDRDLGVFEMMGSTEEQQERARQERDERAAAQRLEDGGDEIVILTEGTGEEAMSMPAALTAMSTAATSSTSSAASVPISMPTAETPVAAPASVDSTDTAGAGPAAESALAEPASPPAPVPDTTTEAVIAIPAPAAVTIS